MRAAHLLAAMAAVITLGCDIETWNPTPRPAATDGGAASDVQPVMATVNGDPIYMDQLNDILVANYGMKIAQQLIANKLVEQEARRAGVTVTDDDIRAENDYLLRQITDQPKLEPAHRRELLARMLAEQGISHADYERILRREALLRKIVAPQVRITESELRDEFDRQFGRQVQVRHIQVESLAAAEQILQMARDGMDFARLARQYSLSPSAEEGGLLPPIGAMSTEWPPVIRDVAMSLHRPGEISEIVRTGTAYHVLRLERDIPPKDVSFEKVKDELLVSVRRRVIDQAKHQLMGHLLAQADVQFIDRTLGRQYARRDIKP